MIKLQERENLSGIKQFFTTIPKHIIKKMKWKKGKELHFVINKRGNVEIVDEILLQENGVCNRK